MIDFASVRSTTRWGGVAQNHAGVGEFERRERLSDGLHTISGGPVPIDVLLRLKPGAPVVFSFHGNTPRNPDLKLPVFTGLNVTRDLDASFAALSDPTLYLDPELKLAWYAGSSGWDLQSILKRVLRKIATIAKADDLIFLGGSGGGFASLYYAANFPGSLALVWNPQTDIGAYNPPHVTEYGRMAFGLADHASTVSALPTLTESVLARTFGGSLHNQIIYLQNNTDGHVITHMHPFLASLGTNVEGLERGVDFNGEIIPGFRLYMANWGDGHVPPSPAALTRLLNAAVSEAGKWSTMLGSDEFGQLLDEAITAPTNP